MSAIFSPCRTWRYWLERRVSMADGTLAVIGVNPSTADERKNDPTIRKDIGFAERWGYGRLLKGNLLAYRATDINDLKHVLDPVGPENDFYLESIITDCDKLLVAWGATAKLPPRFRERWMDFVALAHKQNKPMYCFGTTNDGQPFHPLYIPYDRQPVIWTPP